MKRIEAKIVQLLTCPPSKGCEAGDVSSEPVTELVLGWEGILSDRHYGRSLRAGARERDYASQGQPLTNLRQVSIVCEAELGIISQRMGSSSICGADLGANIVLMNINNLTSFPAGFNSVIRFESGAILYCTGENEPCEGPGQAIARRLHNTSLANKFPKAAMHRRGIVAMVGCPGVIRIDENVEIFYPSWSDWDPNKISFSDDR